MTQIARFDSIQTERLLMRRWLESDREPFAALNGDPETMKFFPARLDRAGSDAFVDRIESLFELQGYGLWALEVAVTGQRLHRAQPDADRRARCRRYGGWLAASQARLAPRLRDRGGTRCRRHRLCCRWPDRSLVHDSCAERAIAGRYAPTRNDRGGQVRPAEDRRGSPAAAARDLPLGPASGSLSFDQQGYARLSQPAGAH